MKRKRNSLKSWCKRLKPARSTRGLEAPGTAANPGPRVPTTARRSGPEGGRLAADVIGKRRGEGAGLPAAAGAPEVRKRSRRAERRLRCAFPLGASPRSSRPAGVPAAGSSGASVSALRVGMRVFAVLLVVCVELRGPGPPSGNAAARVRPGGPQARGGPVRSGTRRRRPGTRALLP